MSPQRADAVDLAVREGTRWYFAIEVVSILNVKLLQLFIMEMRTLACGFVISGCS